MLNELKALKLKEHYDDFFEMFSDATKATLFVFFTLSFITMTSGIGIALFHIFS